MIPFEIRSIPHKDAIDLIVRRHYLHRACPCSFSFGLFKGYTLYGVIIYGTPSSAPLRRGICGDDEKDNVIELTRLWISDQAGKNTESYFIAHTLPLINKEIVVSFADPTQNHVGIVYQATNWIYTGLSAKRTNWTVKGIDKHCQTIADKYTSEELREKYGDDFTLVDRPQKHRYIFFNCDKRRKRVLLKKLKYPILPYPKLVPTKLSGSV